MPKPFDATLKDIVREHPLDITQALRQACDGPPTVLNVDLSTVTAATDVALGHGDPPRHITDLNFQSGFDVATIRRVFLYQAVLHYRYSVPVHSVIVLLRPAADGTHMSGRLRYVGAPRRGKMDLEYEVIRLWQRPVERMLQSGIGALPLVPLCRMRTATTRGPAQSAARTRNPRQSRDDACRGPQTACCCIRPHGPGFAS